MNTIRNGDVETYYYFDTDFTGPELLIKHISSLFPELEFMLVSSEESTKYGKIKEYYQGNTISDEELSEEEIVYWFGEDEF